MLTICFVLWIRPASKTLAMPRVTGPQKFNSAVYFSILSREGRSRLTEMPRFSFSMGMSYPTLDPGSPSKLMVRFA
eukprot:6192573-Pleurochrysis_carterae.AAC.1